MVKTIEKLADKGERALVLGIGGGGDVVGALATARYLQVLGVETIVGGLSWERYVSDPDPGPRKISEMENVEILSDTTALVNSETRTDKGVEFTESVISGILDKDVLILDLNLGVQGVIDGLNSAVDELNLDFIVGNDVGGDVLARGNEEGLHSMLADSMVLAALPNLKVPAILGVLGFGADGELKQDQLFENFSEIASGGGYLGARGLVPEDLELLDEAVSKTKTEASALAVRAARGEIGEIDIRGGYRKVELSPVSSVTFFFDPEVVVEKISSVAKELEKTKSLDEAHDILEKKGVPSELSFERNYVWKDYTDTDELFEGEK
ncbi:hypothetical protein AKJ55_01430 [candidate division MSBL1 archaeon SCGC-AAA382M17]|uniref:DUF1152 domain-containing protein n=1 Tax=candidate division MSBL1 archaeon SCGC-AAA382M17 TaxID=1698284 RepID=A0ABR5TJE0_9EURY|nr:hypothetical protein AKJ55_01430 [candidate division MSBL1 archaeon SCGC-AAA382M17]